MRQINLLPNELRPGQKSDAVTKKIELALIAILAVYIVVAAISIGATYYLGNKLKDLTNQKQALSSELKGLSSVENSTIYIRDRIGKYESITDKDLGMKNYTKYKEAISQLPSEVKVEDVSISGNSITYKVTSPNVSVFSQVLQTLVDSQIYKNILVSGINFHPGAGYEFGLSMSL